MKECPKCGNLLKSRSARFLNRIELYCDKCAWGVEKEREE